jgi:hypothetical protein
MSETAITGRTAFDSLRMNEREGKPRSRRMSSVATAWKR